MKMKPTITFIALSHLALSVLVSCNLSSQVKFTSLYALDTTVSSVLHNTVARESNGQHDKYKTGRHIFISNDGDGIVLIESYSIFEHFDSLGNPDPKLGPYLGLKYQVHGRFKANGKHFLVLRSDLYSEMSVLSLDQGSGFVILDEAAAFNFEILIDEKGVSKIPKSQARVLRRTIDAIPDLTLSVPASSGLDSTQLNKALRLSGQTQYEFTQDSITDANTKNQITIRLNGVWKLLWH